jgi:hypothetical protein
MLRVIGALWFVSLVTIVYTGKLIHEVLNDTDDLFHTDEEKK